MLSSITKSISGKSTSSDSANVNMLPRAGKKTATKGRSGSGDKGTPSGPAMDAAKTLEMYKNELQIKDAAIAALSSKVDRLEDEKRSKDLEGVVKRRHHPVVAVSNLINDSGRQRVRMGTRGSMLTQNILEAAAEVKKSQAQVISEKFLKVFQNPVDYLQYLKSEAFANDLIMVCQSVGEVFEEEPRVLFMQSPVYVFGDVHGNLEDLHFFADNIWKLGMDLTAGKFLFLGDYVDRGMSSLEVVAYLFGLKLLYPNKIELLRGNHETRDVNGWEQHYQEKSFLFQCKDRFGVEMGETLWEEVNQAFDRLPLSAVIDHEIFCIHGGIPRPIIDEDEPNTTEIQTIMALPNIISVMPPYEHEEDWMRQVATDCIWSDPASEEMESMLDETGFGESPRGGGAVCFGSTAIDNFLAANNLSYIIRAHEAHAHGVSLSKSARVFTVFSTSKDHRQGERAMAGCILIDNEQIQVINRSPKYKNKYVHRRTSVSLSELTPEQVEERRRLGLVRFSLAMEDMSRLVQQAGLDELIDETDEAQAKADRERETAGSKDYKGTSTETHRPSF